MIYIFDCTFQSSQQFVVEASSLEEAEAEALEQATTCDDQSFIETGVEAELLAKGETEDDAYEALNDL